MPSQLWISVFCLFLWMRLILEELIESYKHTVYYVMQIGAITLASMLWTVTEHHNPCYKQTNGTAVLDVSNVLCEYEL